MGTPTPNPTPGPLPSPIPTTPHPIGTPMPTPDPMPGPPPPQIPTIPHVTGTVSYPVEHLLSTSHQVQSNVQQALDPLPGVSSKLTDYINGFPETMQESITGLLGKYIQRIEHSYATQQLFAAWLELAAYEMQKTDGQIQTSFSQFLTEVADNKIQPNY